jgi:hypothetical protein
MCGGAVGAATVNGPQGAFKVRENGTFSLLESRGSTNNLSVQGTFDNHELRNVKMTVGGGLGTPGDQIEFRNDGKVIVNGEEVNGEITTANGTKISKNGDQVVIKTPDGDSFKMYLSFCQPPAINMEGEIAPNRVQGEVAGLVGTFDDSIPEGQFPEGLGGTREGDPNTARFWASWALKNIQKSQEEEEKRRQAAKAEAEKAAQKSADGKKAAEAPGEAPKPGEAAPGTGEAPKPGTGDGPKTGAPTGTTPTATPVAPGVAVAT